MNLEHLTIPSSRVKNELHIDIKSTITPLRIIFLNVAFLKRQRFLALNANSGQNRCVLVPLVKRRCGVESHKRKPLLSVVGNDLDPIKEHADLLVRVSDGDIESEIVGERAVVCGGEIKLREGCVSDGEFEILRLKDDREDRNGEDDDGDRGNGETYTTFESAHIGLASKMHEN